MSVVDYNYLWFTGNYESYWDGFFFFPEKEALTYSDNLSGVTPIYALARLFSGGNLFTAFQLLILFCHILNFLSCYWCLNKLSGNKYAASTGAFIFAFSLALNGIHNHPQFTFRFCIPIFFYFLYLYLSSPNFKMLLYTTLILILQFYIGAYLGTFLMVTGGFFAFCYIIIYRLKWSVLKKIFLQGLIVAPIAILLMLPQLYFYYKRVKITGFYADYNYYMETVPRFSSYFKAFPGSYTWSWLAKTDVYSQYSWLHFLFPGAIVIICILTGFYFTLKKDKLFMLLIATIALLLCFTIYYDGHTLFGFLMKVPGVKTARVVTRLITVLLFLASWLVCLNINKLLAQPLKIRYTIIALLPLLLFADNYCSAASFKTFSKEVCIHRVDLVRNKYLNNPANKQKKVFAFTPGIKKDSHHFHLDAMLAALTLKVKTVNGYSSSCNRYYGPFWTNIDSISLVKWCNSMNYPVDSILILK